MRKFGLEYCSPLGEVIRDERLKKGLKQSDLGKLLGCSATKIHMMEYAETYHSKVEDLEAIAKALEIDVNKLIEKADITNPYKKPYKNVMTECVFNDGVECLSTARCDKCGWSPLVSGIRKEKRKRAEKNRRKEQEHIVYESWKY